MYLHALAYLIFVGTEQGLWVSLDNGASFQQWKSGYPSVSTYDLAIQEREADLAIATFGRAIYILDDIRPLRKLANSKGMVSKKVTAFAAPAAIQAEYRNAPGYEWSTLGLWDAENRRAGAAISYYVMPDSKDTAKKQRADSALVKVYNDKNEVIRNLRWKADTGFNRSYWNMDEKGFRNPGTPRPRPGQENGGWEVLPGNYKVVITLGKDADSTTVTVKDDPRIGNRNDIKIAQRNLQLRLRKSVDKLVEGMDRLTEAEEVARKVDAQYKDMEGKDADSLRKVSRKMQDEIKGIREFISGKPQTRQGYGQVPQITVMNQLQQANGIITAKPIVPGETEQRLVKQAEGLIDEAVQKINAFFSNSWKKYRQQTENTPLKLFKEYKEIETP